MIDEVKFQELKDAAAHAKHNGGRVSVDWDVLDELLGAWKLKQPAFPPPVAPSVIAAAVDVIPEQERLNQEPSIVAPAGGDNPDDAPPVTPEPTIQ